MAGKQAGVKSGVWAKLNYVEGQALDKLSQKYINAVNIYRNNPCAETEQEMNFQGKSFKDAWKAIK